MCRQKTQQLLETAGTGLPARAIALKQSNCAAAGLARGLSTESTTACISGIKMGILTAAESVTELALRMSAAESSCFRPDQVSHHLSPVGTAADLHC